MKQFILCLFLSCVIMLSAAGQDISNNVFTLSENLRLDKDFDGQYGGQMFFHKDSVMLYVTIARLDVKAKRIDLSYSILRARDTVNVYPDFYTFEITKKGWQTDTVKNVVKLEKYKTDKKKLENQLKKLQEDLLKIPPSEVELIREKNEAIGEKQNQLNTLAIVEPVYVYDDRFDDVVFVYVQNGLLTEAGRQWVKGLPFHKKKPLSLYVN